MSSQLRMENIHIRSIFLQQNRQVIGVENEHLSFPLLNLSRPGVSGSTFPTGALRSFLEFHGYFFAPNFSAQFYDFGKDRVIFESPGDLLPPGNQSSIWNQSLDFANLLFKPGDFRFQFLELGIIHLMHPFLSDLFNSRTPAPVRPQSNCKDSPDHPVLSPDASKSVA